MPLESSESSDSSESDKFDLERLIQSHHLRRVLMDKNPSKWARSERGRENDDEDEDDDVTSSSGSSKVNIPKTRSDWTRRSGRNARGKRRGGKMSRSNTNEHEYDEDNGREPLPSTRGPYHALQLAADRLTGDFQDDIAQQLESVEEQLEAVGLQMQEAIAAGFKDGTFKSRIRSSDVEATERQSVSADIQVAPVGSRKKGSASIPKLRDSGSQTSPSCMQYSTHTSTDPFLCDDDEYTPGARQPLKRLPQPGDDKEPSRQSQCPVVAGKSEDKHEDDVAASSSNVQSSLAADHCGFEYSILKLEGMDPDSKGFTSSESIVSGDSTLSDQTQAESKLYQARGCQTCRCHSCRVPSDPVQTVQILGVAGHSQGESSASRSREFVTMDIKKGRIPQSLGLIEICRDYEAQEGEYGHIWKQSSVLQPFKAERSATEVMSSPVNDEEYRLHVAKSPKPSELGGRSIRDHFQGGDESFIEDSEEPETRVCKSAVRKSKYVREGPTSSKGRGVQRLGNLYDEAEKSPGQYSPLISCADLLQEADQSSKENCGEPEARKWRSSALKSKPERSISLEGPGIQELENLYDEEEYPARKPRSLISGADLLQEVGQSSKEKFEKPKTRKRQKDALKSKLVRELRYSLESRGVQKLGSLHDETENAAGRYSSLILKTDLLQEPDQSSGENSEEPETRKWEGAALRSTSVRERTISLEGSDDQEFGNLFDEAEYTVERSSPITLRADLLHDAGRTSNLKENSEEPETRKLRSGVVNSKPLGERRARVEGRGVQERGSVRNETEFSTGPSSSVVNRLEKDMEPSGYTNAPRSGHANDLTTNIRSEIFSVVDEQFEYSASRSTDDSLEVEGPVGRKERNSIEGPETHSVLRMQRHSSSPSQDIEAQKCKNRDIETVKFEEEHILSGPRQSQNTEERRSKSNLNPDYQPDYGTRSWSHQKLKQKSDRIDRTSRDRDTLCSSSTFAGEGTFSVRPEEETSSNVVANRKFEPDTKPQSSGKGRLVASRSNYESTPSVGGVSSQRLTARASRRSPLNDFLQESRPDLRPLSSETRTERETDEAPNRRVAQSRVYIGIRQEYEPGDHVGHQEMQRRMQDEIAKEFALLGIHSQVPGSRKSIRSKSKSGVRDPSSNSHENKNVIRPETFQVEESSPSLHNLYRVDIDLGSKAPRMFSLDDIPTQVYNDIPIEYSSAGQIGDLGEGALDQTLQDVHVEHQDPRVEPRGSATQRLADVGRSKRRSTTVQRPRFEQDDFVEPRAADSNTDVTHRRPTPYPLSSSASARLHKEELVRQLQSPQKLEDFPAKRTGECAQESDKPHWAVGDGGISVTKASSSGDYQAPDLRRRGDVILQILNRKSSRSGTRRKTRETSIQHTVTNIPRGCSLQPESNLTRLSRLQDSTPRMDSINANIIHGPLDTESVDSSIPIKSLPSTLLSIPRSFRDSETREPPTKHPTMIDQDWNDPSHLDDVEEYEGRNCQKPKRRNLKTLGSKSSQKYLAKMLTRLSQKLAVLESEGLIESNVQTQHSQHFVPQGIPPSETTESGVQDWTPGPLTRRQGSVESELRQQFDRLRSRKSQDFANSMRRRRSQWPFPEDSSIETKDTLSWSFVDDDGQKTSDTSTKWSHRSSRASMLTNNLELLAMEIASKRNEMSQKQELQEEWHPGTPHSFGWRDQYEEVEPQSKHHPQLQGRSENHTMRTEAVSGSAAEQDYPTQMPPEGFDYWRPLLPETYWETGGEDGSPGPSTRRQAGVDLELRPQFDHLHLRKSEDSTNLMRRRRSQWPFQEGSSFLTKDTLPRGLVNDDFSEARKMSPTSTKWSHHSSRSSTLANNLELLYVEMASKREEISDKQETGVRKEWQPRTPHSLSWRDQSQEVEAKSKHRSHDPPENYVMRVDADSSSRTHRGVQTQMPSSFKDRSSRRQSEMAENRESPSLISVKTQTLNEMQSKDGLEVLSRPSIHHSTFASTEAFHRHHLPPNSGESPWDRSLERWNPRASKGGQLRQQVDSMVKAKEQSPAQTRNGTSTQTDEFGRRGHPTFEPQFHQHDRSQRMDSMETQPEDLGYRGSKYPEHPLPQLGDSSYLHGQQDSRFHQIGSHQHPMSQSQGLRGIPLKSEEEEVENFRLPRSHVPQQSELDDMVSMNSRLSHNQTMEGTGVQHGTVRGMGGMNFMNLPHSPVPMPQELQTDTVARSHQHFQDDSMYSFRIPESVVSGFPYHSQSGRKYDHALQAEGITLEMPHPPQSGGMYRRIVQPEGMEDRNRSSPQMGGKYGFAEHSQGNESRSTRPSQGGRMSNLLVQPEGVGLGHHTWSGIYSSPDSKVHHQSRGGGMSGHAEQSEVDSVNLHPSQRGMMPNIPVHAVDLEPGNHHHSQIDRLNSFAGRPNTLESEPERMHGFAVQPDDMDFGRSPNVKNMNNFVAEPEIRNPRHPSQKAQMYSSQVQAGSTEPGSRHLSKIERMQSFAVQPEVTESGIGITSQKRVPEIRTSHHSVVRMPENSSKDIEALHSERGGGEKKTSSARHSLDDLPPEVLSLGSKNPRKSSQIQMLNDMLQDLEVTVSKSRRNSQARMKSHMLEHKFDLVAGRKSKELPKEIKVQAPEDEQSNLGEKVEENFDRFDRETSDHLETENLESPRENPETFHGEHFHGEQLDGESVHAFEDELPESQPEFEDEKSESHTFEGGNFDHLEGEQSRTPEDTSDYLPGDASVAGQQDEQSDLEGSSHAVQGSDHHDRQDSSSSRRSSSSHSSGGTRLNSQRGSQSHGSPRRLQSHMKAVPRASSLRSKKEGMPRASSLRSKKDVSRTSRLNSERRSRAQTKDMPQQSAETDSEPDIRTELKISETGEELVSLESESEDLLPSEAEGEELVPYETQSEELTSLETHGEDFTLLGTGDDIGSRELPAKKSETYKRRVTSRVVDGKDRSLKAKAKKSETIAKDFASGGSNSGLSARYKW